MRRFAFLLSAPLAFLFAATVTALSASGNRLLVVLDDDGDMGKASHSRFFGDLAQRGFDITYQSPKSESLQLKHLGQLMYDHMIIFPTSKVKGLGPKLTTLELLGFVNGGGNVMVTLAANNPAPSALVSFLDQMNVTLPPERTGVVVDHFNFDASSVESAATHDVLLVPPPPPLHHGTKWFFQPEVTVASSDAGPLLAFPRGVGHLLGASPLLTPVLRAPRFAYSYDPKEQAGGIEPDELFAVGSQLKLVSVLQARNSARVVVVGSVEMLADAWFERKVRTPAGREALTWNREFAHQLSGWTFQELGVLRVNEIEHHLNEEPEESSPSIYRVRSDVTYSISISEWEWDKWIPFDVPTGDALQLEFSMLSPFWRLNLSTETSSGDRTVYTTSFKTPHQHGIFNFMVDYHRAFLTYLEEKRTVTVRHMAHDEWRRSYEIVAAWPWVGALWTMIAGWLMFVFLWLYSTPRSKSTENKKKQ